MLIVDAHEDLAWNMLTFGRDYTLSAAEIRRREAGSLAVAVNDETLLGWPDYQRGRVAVVFATMFASPLNACQGDWDILCYADQAQAAALYRRQLEAYFRLTETHPDKFQLVTDQRSLEQVLKTWQKLEAELPAEEASAGEKQPGGEETEGDIEATPGPRAPVGLVLSMEGAEAIRHPEELEWWWEQGVRLIGPAWSGNRFCGGTRMPGPLTKDGYALLDGMAACGFGLDLSHMDELAARQALDDYPGVIIASHSNFQGLLRDPDTNRHLSEAVVQGLIERQGVIGVVPFNAFLKAGWRRGDRREAASLYDVVAQIDSICQIAGDAWHVGLGSDFDGGFGRQSVPPEIESVADLAKIAPLLQERGYSDEQVAAILGKNWLRKLTEILPEQM